MSDLKSRASAQRSPRKASPHSMEGEAGESLGLDDLAAFGEEELICESRREVIRRSRDNRRAAREQRDLDKWERLVLGKLLIFRVVAATLISFVGLFTLDSDIVKAGVVALCAAEGFHSYRGRR